MINDTINPDNPIRNISHAASDLGINIKVLEGYIRIAQPLNGCLFEQVSLDGGLSVYDRIDAQLMMVIREVRIPPDLRVGDYLLVKDGKVLIYGNLMSVAKRCNIPKGFISTATEKAQKDEYGRLWIYVKNESDRRQLTGGSINDVDAIRKEEIFKAKRRGV